MSSNGICANEQAIFQLNGMMHFAQAISTLYDWKSQVAYSITIMVIPICLTTPSLSLLPFYDPFPYAFDLFVYSEDILFSMIFGLSFFFYLGKATIFKNLTKNGRSH